MDERLVNPGYLPISMEYGAERFSAIRANYKAFKDRVARGLDDWKTSDPYELGNWTLLFTPIEAAVWNDLREVDAGMWPQLPVGRFFVDFGCPLRRKAIECDGAAFHDAAKDAQRDRTLLDAGWAVMRIPGWQCFDEKLSREIRRFLGVQP